MKVFLRFLTILTAALVCFACPQPNNCLPSREVTVTNITDSSALVSWTPVAGVSTYQLRLLKLVDTSTQVISTTIVTGTSQTLTNLTPNTNYRVEVRSQCSEGVFSPPTSQTFKSGGVIIDDIVFVDPGRSQGCAGQTPPSPNTHSYVNGVSINLLQGQAMRVKIMTGAIGGPRGDLLSEFVIVSRYPSSQRNALWTLLKQNISCQTNPPLLMSEKTDVVTNGTLQGADLVFTRGNKQFKMSFDKDIQNSVSLSPLPANTFAIIDIYQTP